MSEISLCRIKTVGNITIDETITIDDCDAMHIDQLIEYFIYPTKESCNDIAKLEDELCQSK